MVKQRLKQRLKEKKGMIYKPKYFRLEEFKCPECGQVHINAGLVLLLDAARSMAGHPFKINSGWRCAKHNREVGGVENSRHLLGCAADVACPGKMIFARFADVMREYFGMPGYECKMYQERGFIHVAVPRENRFNDEWDGGYIYIGRNN